MQRLRPFPLYNKLARLASPPKWQPAWFLLLAVLLGGVLTQLSLADAGLLLLRTAVLLLTLIEPMVGLLAALLTGPLGATESSGLLDSGQFFLLWSLLAWLAHGLRNRRLFFPRTFLAVPLALFIGITAVSSLNAPSYSFALKELLKWIEMLAIMLMVLDRVRLWQAKRDESQRFWPIVWLLAALFLAGMSQALLGIYQFGLRGSGPEHFLVLGRFYRAFGTFNQPNPFAGFLNLTAVLSLGIFLSYLPTLWQTIRNPQPLVSILHSSRLWSALAIGFVTAVTLLGIIFSWSRGAWLSLGVATAVLILFWPQKRWHGVLLLLLGAGVLLLGLQVGLIPASISERIIGFSEDLRFGDVRGEDITDENYAILERLAHWQAALAMAEDNPWLGVGFGNYEPAYADYALINWPYPLGHAHNYYLNLLAETGLIGLLAYLLLWTAVFWQTFQLIWRQDGWQRGVALGLLAVWVTLTVHHLVDKLYVNNIYIHLGVMFGLLQLLDDRYGYTEKTNC